MYLPTCSENACDNKEKPENGVNIPPLYLSEWHFFFWKLANGVHAHASGPDPKHGNENRRTKESRRARESKHDRQTRAQHGAAGQASLLLLLPAHRIFSENASRNR